MGDLPPIGNQSEPEDQVGALLNLSYVVRNMQNELNDYSMQQFKRLLQLVIDGLGEIRIYDSPAIQVSYIQVNSAGIASFPRDYIGYTKIGVYIHGRLVTLTLNNNMALNRAQECTDDIRVMENEGGDALITGLSTSFLFAPHYRGTEYIGAMYGAGGGINSAYYKIDNVAKRIQFNGWIPHSKQIVLEYQSTGISAGTVIDRVELAPLKRYAHLMRVYYDPRTPDSTKERMDNDLTKAIGKLRAFRGRFTMSEYMDVLFRAHKASPKP